MENSVFIALSRQGTLKREMDVIANNLANMNTTGFKGQKMLFVEHLVKSRGGDRLLPVKLSFARDVAQITDLSEGPINTTGNTLDVAIRKDGFFVVETPNGQRYTRNGRFETDNQGQLVNQQGFPVLTGAGVPLVFAPEDTDISIARDGTVSSNNGELGQIKLVKFEKAQNLQKEAGGLLNTNDAPVNVDDPVLIQGALEGSNVQPILELSKMIETHRAFESVRSFIDREDQRQKKMIQQLAPRVGA